jgi:subtilisin family serine protease
VAVPLIAQGGFHFRDGGTSSSAPVVAGVAALFQEAYPNADYAQIKNAIMQCAVQDSFTGNQLPNNTWGAGKVNALNTLLNCGLTSLAEPGFETPALVSPNPVSQGQPITVYSNIENAIVELFEISGRKALLGIPVVDWPVKIETYNLSNGVYLLTIRNDRQVFKTQRVVVVGR